ncbi:hypothetical protein Tco_1076318 [Tanacetum coccineum]
MHLIMHSDETPDAYLNRVQEYADALTAIGEPVKDKDLVMLVVSLYGTCNICGIGHILSRWPNHEPFTIRTRPSANFANTRAQSPNASANWHSDTGANSHVTPDSEEMDNLEAYYDDDALHVGSGKGLPILHIGSSKVYSPQKMFSLKNTLHVPEISHNLLSKFLS